MSEPVVIQWEQVKMSGVPLEHWLATISSPVRSVIFASVSRSTLGQWFVNFSPKGRGLREPVTHFPYPSREKAVAHIERWGRAHWQTIPLWKHPQDRRI